jgi:phage replication-related protein YjqB (UPF0714/DUF867 family)
VPPAGFHADAAALMADEDKFPDMGALFAAAAAGRDYRVHCRAANSDVAIVAPHGGCIEPATFELADAIAGSRYKFYCFEAIGERLHVTSTNFDCPLCLRLVETSDYVVTIHGCKDKEAGSSPDLTVAVGGCDISLGALVRENLEASGFGIGDRPELAGVHPLNICNRGRRRRGVQLELTWSLRERLLQTMTAGSGAPFAAFVQAVDRAIQQQIRQG